MLFWRYGGGRVIVRPQDLDLRLLASPTSFYYWDKFVFQS
jgi:hypothetical protein